MTPRSWQWLWRAWALLAAAVLLAPILIVVPMSFTNSSTLAFPPEGLSLRWYSELFTNPQWTLRIPVSVETAFATAMLATVLGTLAALGMTRGSFPGRGLLTGLFLAPLVVPIIDNTARECDLADAMGEAIVAYPRSNAVLVRRHGVYVWGPDWVRAKTHAECYDYLFRAAVEMRRLGVSDASLPSRSADAYARR